MFTEIYTASKCAVDKCWELSTDCDYPMFKFPTHMLCLNFPHQQTIHLLPADLSTCLSICLFICCLPACPPTHTTYMHAYIHVPETFRGLQAVVPSMNLRAPRKSAELRRSTAASAAKVQQMEVPNNASTPQVSEARATVRALAAGIA